MGAKDTMKTFFSAMNEQVAPTRGYGPKIVSTPMGSFSFNDALGVWVNTNNGMQMPNIAFQDMYAMMDYDSIGGDSNVTPFTPIATINQLLFSPNTQNVSNAAGDVAITPTFTISGNNVPITLKWFSADPGSIVIKYRKNGGVLTTWPHDTSSDPVSFSAGDTLQIFANATGYIETASLVLRLRNITANVLCSNTLSINVVIEG